MKNRKGISLVVLTFTILVIVILASTVIFYVDDTMINSKISAFALDINSVEELVYEYYLNNNELPIKSTQYDKETLIGFITNGKEVLSKEIADNKDDDAEFYIIDLKMLPIKTTTKGMQVNSDIRDSYVIAKDSMNIYYLKGEKIRNKYYFSLTQEIIKRTELNIDKTVDNSTINITNTTSTIKYKKNTNDWTNTLTVEVNTELSSEETLKYILAGTDITTSITTNIVNVSEILNGNVTLKTTFHAQENNKILKIQKIKSSQVVTETTVSLSNLDMISGSTINNAEVKYTEHDSFILADISAYTDLGGSGVKEARVLYAKKLNSSKTNLEKYYVDLPDTIDAEYIKNAGKLSSPKIIKLPKDVIEYAVVFIDNAGNVSEICKFKV